MNSPNRHDRKLVPWYLPVGRAGLEAAVAVVLLGALASWFVGAWGRPLVVQGLALAWLAGTVGTAALAWGQAESPKWFWRAFGFGTALRALVLVVLIVMKGRGPWQEVGVLCGAYVAWLTAVILLEFRHLVKDL